MFTTYYVETKDKNIIDYYTRLETAKNMLRSLTPNNFRIVCLKGPYKYEGFHAYYMQWNGKKFTRTLKG